MFFFFNDTATTEIYTLSLHDALPISRVPESGEYAGRIGAYLGAVLPHYAYNFLDWWRESLRPEMDRNFAYLDGQDTGSMDMVELAVLLEDAIDIHDRHWKIQIGRAHV